jgi:predicted PurR-regulated permease PerM
MAGKISFKQVNNFLFGGVLIGAVLYYGRPVLVPVTFSIFLAMLFTPLSNAMERKGVKRVFSASISIIIMIIAVTGIALLLYAQARKLAGQWDRIDQRCLELAGKAQNYISDKLEISVQKQDELINKQLRSVKESTGNMVRVVVSEMAGITGMFVIVLVFTFLHLFRREKYSAFFMQLFGDEQQPDETKKVIAHVGRVAQRYLTGRVISIFIFTVLFTAGFLAIGLESAFLLAFIAALLTIVPYVGSIVGGLFPFVVALVTADLPVAIGALAVVVIIQGIDNYFIEPYIIGGEVNISAFFTILILIVGGMMWGIAGMVLFLPMLGVVKIIFDAVPHLKPYGYLIGDQEQLTPWKKLLDKIKKLFNKQEVPPL